VKKTLAIAYNGGAYGTYLEWVLNTLTTNVDVTAPFTKQGDQIGNSHGSKLGHHLIDMQGWKSYLASSDEFDTVRFHPKTASNDSLTANLNLVLRNCDKMVLVYPDTATKLLCVNNYMTKIWNDDVYSGPLKDFKLADLQRFPIDPTAPINQIPRWIVREHMSFYLMPSWHDQVEWNFLTDWRHARCLNVTVTALLDNFESTVDSILKFWDRTPLKQVKDLVPVHQQMLELQTHRDQDHLCNAIIDCVVRSGPDFEWTQLPIASEAWIQWQLRNHGLEIRCDKLNQFPCSTDALKDLVYSMQ
jgi:hypothetical protein